LRIIYLFGAGASLPASLPGIGKMTEDFFTNIIHSNKNLSEIEEHLREKVKVLEKITKESFDRFDLETFITLIVDLANNEYKTIFQKNYPDLENISKEDLQNIKLMTYGYIRQKLEGINSEVVTYLSPLQGLIGKNNSLNIFTLNYDGTIEALCEKHAISYSDGFTPYWDPNIFNDPNIKVKILKLHGSLYWLKSASGKIIRVPLKGLEIGNVKYFLDESLSEMMIYPALRKEKYSEVYSWLSSKFISELNNSELCIIIGYSFRDKDIRYSD